MKTCISLHNFGTMPGGSKKVWRKFLKYPLQKLLVLTILENVV